MIIDIGSGPHPKMNADIRMDFHPWAGVTHQHDLTITPYPFTDQFFAKAYMGDVVEHISIFDIDRVLTEVARILKPGGILEVTVPDARWIFERIVANDWNEKCSVDWLNSKSTPWDNAMSYLFGGFHNKDEYKIPGMGHIAAYDYFSLKALLEKNGFCDCLREPDFRNKVGDRDAILKMVCQKC